MTTARAHAERWQRIVSMPDGEINLAEAALVIAAEEYPELDVDAYLRRIEDMAAALHRRLREDITTTETILALNHYLFKELGYAGNADDYYDPRNSFLNEVMDRKLGIPITLSVVYVEVGRRVGLSLQGVSFPGNFLVRCAVRDGVIVLDPYAGGASLGVDDLRQRLRTLHAEDIAPDAITGMLTAAHNRDILARMLRNLKEIHRAQEDWQRLIAVQDRLLVLLPDAWAEYRDRGLAHAEQGHAALAVLDLETYLIHAQDSLDIDAIADRVADLRRERNSG